MVCVHSLDLSVLDKVKAKGHDGVRVDVFHSSVVRRLGTFNYDLYDPFMKRAKALGLKVLIVLYLENKNLWVGAGRYVPTSKDALAQVEAFCRQTAYQYRWADFEVWNEPNSQKMMGRVVNPLEYAKIAKAAVRGLRTANPNCKVWLGGLANEDGTDEPDWRWIESMVADESVGGGGLWRVLGDGVGVSIHPYSKTQMPEARYRAVDLFRYYVGGLMPVDKDIPLAFTEWGYARSWGYTDDQLPFLVKRMLDVGDQDGVDVCLYSWDDPTGEGFGLSGVQVVR